MSDRPDDRDAALGRAAHALRGLLEDLEQSGLDHLPRVKLAPGRPAAGAGGRSRKQAARSDAGPDAPDGRYRKEDRRPPAPAPDADRGAPAGEAPTLADLVTGPEPAGERLRVLDQDIIGDCQRCKLHRGRTRLVFGVGNPAADLVFVGEGPGADEDRQGIPFVGRAGQLLTRMIAAMGRERDDVYICNVVKCRPPNNRDPEPDEVESCEPFLKAQLGILQPRVIVGLGRCASQTLLRTRTSISRMRGKWTTYEGIDFMPTFHPSYLLRSPEKKREAWHDLQLVMKRLDEKPRQR